MTIGIILYLGTGVPPRQRNNEKYTRRHAVSECRVGVANENDGFGMASRRSPNGRWGKFVGAGN